MIGERAKRILENLLKGNSGCIFILLIDTAKKAVVAEVWKEGITGRERIRENLIHILDYVVLRRQKSARNPFMRKALQDFRGLIFEMEKGYVLFTPTPLKDHVVASGITRETGLGFWRATLTNALEELRNAGD